MTAVLVDLEQLAELVASRVVEMLVERDQAPAAGLVDAATLAQLLGVSRATIYEHAERLGAVQLGEGSKPRLRFDAEQARAAWTRRDTSERSQPADPLVAPGAVRRRRQPAARSTAGLLPVKGRA